MACGFWFGFGRADLSLISSYGQSRWGGVLIAIDIRGPPAALTDPERGAEGRRRKVSTGTARKRNRTDLFSGRLFLVDVSLTSEKYV